MREILLRVFNKIKVDQQSPEKWNIVKITPLYKNKGSRNDPNNYRGVRLLAMESRILARIAADRLRIWSKKMDLLDNNQAGRI